MNINKTWTLLSRGTEDATYGRRIYPVTFASEPLSAAVHDILVPVSDTAFMSLCTEQVVQALLGSSLRDEWIAEDSVNTYGYPLLSMSSNSFATMGVPAGLTVNVLNENTGRTTWTYRNFSVKVVPGTMQVTISTPGTPPAVSTYTVTNGLSSKIALAPLLYLRFSDVMPATAFTFSIQYFNAFHRTLANIVDDLGTMNIPWGSPELREHFTQTRNPVEKVATLALGTFRMLSNANG